MKRKIKIMFALFILIFGITIKTDARESVYYTTQNGLELTEQEYNYLKTFYWEDYVDMMSEEQYFELLNSGFFEKTLITSEDNENVYSPESTSHTTPYKSLKISAVCSSDICSVSLVANWLYDPSVRSWDVIGMYFSGPSLSSHQQTVVFSTTSTNYFSNTKSSLIGFGNSVQLPSTGSNLVINQILNTTKGGHIFGSYQHAVQNITLAVSKNYDFSLSGYGNVFYFTGTAVGKYDGMAGVDLAV